jgi:hypothetical protein
MAKQFQPYVESPKEHRRRVGLEHAIRRRANTRYRVQINLKGPNDGRVYPACSLPIVFVAAHEAWSYMEAVNPMKFFPLARSASVERVV